MTKRIEKKRLKRKYRNAIIGAAMHSAAASSWSLVVSKCSVNRINPILPDSVLGWLTEESKRATSMMLYELAFTLESLATKSKLEELRGKWIPRRWAA